MAWRLRRPSLHVFVCIARGVNSLLSRVLSSHSPFPVLIRRWLYIQHCCFQSSGFWRAVVSGWQVIKCRGRRFKSRRGVFCACVLLVQTGTVGRVDGNGVRAANFLSIFLLLTTNRVELLLHCNQLRATRDRVQSYRMKLGDSSLESPVSRLSLSVSAAS